MKNIDVKSLIIGALLTSTIFLGVAAVPQNGPNKGKVWWTVSFSELDDIIEEKITVWAEKKYNANVDIGNLTADDQRYIKSVIIPGAVAGWEPFAMSGKELNARSQVRYRKLISMAEVEAFERKKR